MFFRDHTTPAEQETGYVNREVLLARIAEHARSGSPGLETVRVEASISYKREVYELEVNFLHTDKVECALAWSLSATEKRVLGEACSYDFTDNLVPLNWGNLLAALSNKFDLNPEKLERKAVDLDAYWSSDEIKETCDFQIPKKKVGRKYRVAELWADCL